MLDLFLFIFLHFLIVFTSISILGDNFELCFLTTIFVQLNKSAAVALFLERKQLQQILKSQE